MSLPFTFRLRMAIADAHFRLAFRLRRAIAHAHFRFAVWLLPRHYVLVPVLYYERLREEAAEWRREVEERETCKARVARALSIPRLVRKGDIHD